MFVLGPAGTGKTQVIKTLNKTYMNQKRKPLLHDINPKAVTADELFGFINPATREWKDGECGLEYCIDVGTFGFHMFNRCISVHSVSKTLLYKHLH